MGNICDCLKGTSDEPAYTPIETVELPPAIKPRPVERSTNNYQTILDKASGNFISSKYRSRSEGVAISNSSEGADSVRSRFQCAEVNPQVVCSPPSTGIIVQSYATFSATGPGTPSRSGAGAGNSVAEGGSASSKAMASAISALHVKPAQDSALESSADALAQIVRKQTDRSIDRFSSNPSEVSAVVGFKPFESAGSGR